MKNPDDEERSGPTRRGLLLGGAGIMIAAQAGTAPAQGRAGAEGFNFLLGRWDVHHRRLRSRLSGSSEWEEFPGTLEVRPILHGLGNVDENVLDDPRGRYLATSLRTFDRRSGQWSIYWVDGRTAGIDKPVIGRFDGRTGRFYNEDEFEGRPIKVRFIYRDLGQRRASWEQAFSLDAGRHWEPNWTMDFHRKKGRR